MVCYKVQQEIHSFCLREYCHKKPTNRDAGTIFLGVSNCLLVPLSSLILPFSPYVFPKNPAKGQGKRSRLPQRVWGETPAEIEFGAF